MKNIFIAFVMLCSTVLLTGQAPFPNKDEIKQFGVSKTCVVLEDDPFSAFNVYIKTAVNSYWKITPFEFIEVREFNVRRLNPKYSFIVLTQTNYEKEAVYTILLIFFRERM